MGSTTTSSKLKKNSVEDRRKRKNTKSRKRRHVSSSPTSYSSDSDAEPLVRRRSRRKTEKKRGRDLKRSIKKKHRKVRHRSVSSGSRDSGDSLDRSRSPVRHRDDRKGKVKKVKRGRKLDRVVRSSRSRNRSLSCSTCSGRDSGSNSPRKTHSYRKDKSKEVDGSRKVKSSSVIQSEGGVEEMHGSRDMKTDNELNVVKYDDLHGANDGRDAECIEQYLVMDSGSYGQELEIDRWICESNLENCSYFHQFEDNRTQQSELYKLHNVSSDSSSFRILKSEIVADSKQDFESDDLELMLRQKALENLNKLRAGLSSDNKATNEESVSAGDETSEKPFETAKKIISSSESDSIIAKQRQIQAGVLSDELNLKAVDKLPPVQPNYSASDKKMLCSPLNDSRNPKQLESTITSQNTSNWLNIVENSTDKMSNRQSPYRGSPEKNATSGCDSGNSLRVDLSLGDGLASERSLPNEKENIRESNQTLKECQSGSQFEKKTFSRMHDGEMVQVSYKVYIPNKSPALARRKLQR